MTTPPQLPANRASEKGGAAHRVLAVVLLLLIAVGAVIGYESLVRARDAADASCLASVHAALIGLGFPRGPERNTWREWTPAEIGRALAEFPYFGDCDNAPDAKWKGELRIRSRRRPDSQPEMELWFKRRPTVSSPWGVPNLE